MLEQNRYLNYKKLLVAFALLILVQPEMLTTGTINKIYKYGGIFVASITLFLVLTKTKVDKGFLWMLMFFGTGLTITVAKNAYISEYIRENIGAFGLCCLFFLCMNSHVEWLVDAFGVLDFYIVINFITILLNPYTGRETGKLWFLGNGNYHIRTVLPILAICLLRSYLKKGKPGIRFFVLLAISFATFLLNNSATGLLTVALFVVLVFVFRPGKKELPDWFTLNTFLVSTVVADLVIVVFRLQYLFSFLIEQVLKRSITLTGRTVIWDRAILCILSKPLTGYGYLVGDAYQSLLMENHPHNYFMYVLMTGGVVWLSVLIAGLFIANNSLKNTKESMVSKIILFIIICFFFMGIDESLTKAPLLYPCFFLGMEVINLNYNNE